MMRGRNDLRLATLLAGVLAVGATPMTCMVMPSEAFAAQEFYVPTAETEIAPTSNMNDGSLFDAYIENRFFGDTKANHTRGNRLSGADRNVYDVLYQAITEIAAGRRVSTAVEVPISCLSSKTYWTATELGMSSFVAGDGTVSEAAVEAVRQALTPDMAAIRSALSQDLSLDLYWYDNGAPLKWTLVGLTVTWDQIRVADAGIIVYLPVASAYAQGTCAIDPSRGALVDGAVRNSDAIIAESQNMSVLDRLAWFRQRICDYTSYDTPVAGEAVPYGDYWQLVYVFDGNPGTEALCEGYAKAFTYLVDRADLSGIRCTTVSGTMGGSSHSWNIVERGGLNYLVDVTNCDINTLGYPDRLFMTREATGSVQNGFTVSPSGCSWSLHYVYDAQTLDAYSTSRLDILNRKGGGSYKASGIWGTCAWELDSSGTLTVHKGTGTGPTVTGRVEHGTLRNDTVSPWASLHADIKHVVLEDGVVLPACSDGLFAGLGVLVTVDATGADTSDVTSMKSLFSGCAKLEEVDLTGWDTSKVTDATGMFSSCGKLQELKVGATYAIGTKDMVPNATAKQGWWSKKDYRWLTAEQIASGRSKVADTYLDHEATPPVDLKEKGAAVSLAKDEFTFDGSAKKPDVTVTLDGKKLTVGKDFEVRYADNTDAGTATATVTGKGAYEGTLTATFEIEPADIEKADIAVEAGTHVFAAKAIRPGVTVTLDDEVLERGSDYRVEFDDNTEAGTATVTVTGKGNYRGTAMATFEIEPEDLEEASVTTAEDSYAQTGEELCPPVTVKLGARTLRRGVDYTADYEDNTEPGTASVTVTGKGNYQGTATGTFEIFAAD